MDPASRSSAASSIESAWPTGALGLARDRGQQPVLGQTDPRRLAGLFGDPGETREQTHPGLEVGTEVGLLDGSQHQVGSRTGSIPESSASAQIAIDTRSGGI
jgi:hypothetical protein